MKKTKKLIVLFVMFIPGFCFSQKITIQPVQFPIDQVNIIIVGLAQDNNGHIWIASNNKGLFKYDGVQLKSFNSNTSGNPTPLSKLESVYADRKGNIWVANFEDGLDKFDPETEIFTHFKHDLGDPSSLISDSVRAILEDREGALWVGTANGLSKLNVETGKFSHIQNNSVDGVLLGKEHIRCIYEDKQGIIWVGCGSPFYDDGKDPNTGGLYSLNKKSGEIKRYFKAEKPLNSLTDNRVRAVFEDSRGVFWVGTAGDGLHTMDRENGTFKNYPYDPRNTQKLSRPKPIDSYNYVVDHITFFNEDDKGYIWIGTFSGGINRYDPVSNSVVHFGEKEPEPYTLPRNDFFACLKTRDNLLWISGWDPYNNNQILYKVITSFNTLAFTDLKSYGITFTQTKDSTVWIGSSMGLVRKNKDSSFDSYLLNKNIKALENIITDLEPDENGDLWVSTINGFFKFNSSTKEFIEYFIHEKSEGRQSPDKYTRLSKLNNDGTISIATSKGLVIMEINSGKYKLYKSTKEDSTTINKNEVYDTEIDKAGNTWVATYLGLNRFDKTIGKFQFELKQKLIFKIFEDSKGRLWLATSNSGLLLYNPETKIATQFYDSTNFLKSTSNILGITEGRDNNLWLRTYEGLVLLNTETRYVTQVGKSWGINASSLTEQLYTSLNNEIFVGKEGGYLSFTSNDIVKNKSAPPQPFISKVYLNNKLVIYGENNVLRKPLSQTEIIELSYNQNNFSFEFDNIDYITNATEKTVLYKLENYESVWRKKTGEEKAYYFNIPPGRYIFRVKAVDLYGQWGERKLIIVISSPWYKTWWAYTLFAIILLFATYLIHTTQKRLVLKKERKGALEKELIQAREIEKAYTVLKATQSQLIQSEKMASLGELTAGIAHEIQNPLNFVNNFSEVNSELIAEMKQEIDKGNLDEVKSIASDIDENEQKINYHGKRADAIVKGMLQHSQSSSGKKEPTDINALADEYLRLSYHGLRAKDKSFNATLVTDYDEGIGHINIIPQDIGRVILNLINNAFYAVSEKKKQCQSELPERSGQVVEHYQPTVSVTITKTNTHIEISVSDNGNGIPQKILDKIFQPFFTTKPTGEGTGLGLSLSYDIVKAHDGEIKVETKQGEGSKFIIQLPKPGK